MGNTDIIDAAEINMEQTLQPGVSFMLTAGGILLLTALIVMTVVIFKRWKGRFVPMLLGAIAYMIFVFIFANLTMSALLLIPSFDIAFDNNPVVYPLLYCILTAIGFTVARLLLGLMLTGRYERQGDIMLCGLGISLGDALLYGMSTITYVVVAMGVENLGLASLFVDMNAEEIITTYEGMATLFTTPSPVWFLYGVSAVLDVILCIVLMMVVYAAINDRIPKIWIFFSGIIQFAVALPFQVADTSSMTTSAIAFLIKLVFFVGSVGYIYKVLAKEFTYSEE